MTTASPYKLIANQTLFDMIALSDKKIIALQGGARSGKTYSALQYLILKMFEEKNITVRVFKKIFKDAKGSVLEDFNNICINLGVKLTPPFNEERTHQSYIINGNRIFFHGLDLEQLHGPTQDYFFINEAQNVNKKVFTQLEIRTKKQGIIDYNPTFLHHDLIDSILARPDCGYIHSKVTDNKFIEQTIIDSIFALEPTPQNIINKTANLYEWMVYGLGERAINEGLVYPTFSEIDIFPSIPYSYGLDFGFSHDPLALVRYAEFENNVYLDEVIYQTGLLTNELIQILQNEFISKQDLIVCDSASPQSIAELKNRGYNVKPAATKDVLWGLNYCRGKNIHITSRSLNLKKEFESYKWKDSEQGKKQEPVKGFDHLLDAFRYRCTYYANRPTHSTIKLIPIRYNK